MLKIGSTKACCKDAPSAEHRLSTSVPTPAGRSREEKNQELWPCLRIFASRGRLLSAQKRFKLVDVWSVVYSHSGKREIFLVAITLSRVLVK